MGSVGPWEILVIAVVGLLVFGPNRLPELGRSLGRALREFRRASQELREEVRKAVDEAEPPAPRSAGPTGAEARRPGSEEEGGARPEPGREEAAGPPPDGERY